MFHNIPDFLFPKMSTREFQGISESNVIQCLTPNFVPMIRKEYRMETSFVFQTAFLSLTEQPILLLKRNLQNPLCSPAE